MEGIFFIFFSGNSEPTKRLFGELEFKGFGVSSNKSKIDWGPPDDDLKELFLEYIFYLIKREKSSDEIARFWKQCFNYRRKQPIEEKKFDKVK
mgnify:CR=1 FL=1